MTTKYSGSTLCANNYWEGWLINVSPALPAGYIKTIATLIFWLLIAAERTGNEKLLNHFDVFVMWMHILKKFKEQILSPQVSMNDTVTIQIEDISVTAVRMQHGTDRSLQGITIRIMKKQKITGI